MIAAVRLRFYETGLKEDWVTSPRKLAILISSDVAGVACILRCLALNPFRQLEACLTELHSKDRASPRVYMLVNFSASGSRVLG